MTRVFLEADHGNTGAFLGLEAYFKKMVPFAAMLLNSALVASEFRHRTQTVIDCLPITRQNIMAVKYGCGLAVLCFATFVTLALNGFLGRDSEVFTSRFLQVLLASSAALVLFWQSLFFLVGNLGRFRFPLLYLAYLLLLLSETLDGPSIASFVLLDPVFGYERSNFHLASLALAAGLGICFLLTALLVAFAGGMGESGIMDRRMTGRERSWTIGVLAALSIALMLFMNTYQPPVTAQENAELEGQPRTELSKVVPEGDGGASEDSLESSVQRKVAAFAVAIGSSEFPSVRLVHRTGFSRFGCAPDTLSTQRQLTLHANLEDGGASEPELAARAVEQCLITVKGGRRPENAEWPLAGAGLAWTRSDSITGPVPDDLGLQLALANPEVLGGSWDPSQWHRHEERWGREACKAISWLGLRVLSRLHGETAWLELLRETARGKVRRRHGVDSLIDEQFGINPDAFHAAWLEEWTDIAAQWRTKAESLGTMSGTAKIVPVGDGAYEVRIRVDSMLSSQYTKIRVRHGRLGPFPVRISNLNLKVIEVSTPRTEPSPEIQIPGVFVPGDTFVFALEAEYPSVDGVRSSGWSKVPIPAAP